MCTCTADLEGKLQAAQRNNQLLHLENERLRTAAESDQRELQEVSTAEAEMKSLIGKFQKVLAQENHNPQR